jgi:DNA-binding XRE family transcriptional regulator
MSYIERGHHYPSLPLLLAICDVLGCRPDDLLWREGTGRCPTCESTRREADEMCRRWRKVAVAARAALDAD